MLIDQNIFQSRQYLQMVLEKHLKSLQARKGTFCDIKKLFRYIYPKMTERCRKQRYKGFRSYNTDNCNVKHVGEENKYSFVANTELMKQQDPMLYQVCLRLFDADERNIQQTIVRCYENWSKKGLL